MGKSMIKAVLLAMAVVILSAAALAVPTTYMKAASLKLPMDFQSIGFASFYAFNKAAYADVVPYNRTYFTTKDTLVLVCWANESQNNSVSYNYTLYEEGSPVLSGSVINVTQGAEYNVANYSLSSASRDKHYYLSCSASGVNSSASLDSAVAVVLTPFGGDAGTFADFGSTMNIGGNVNSMIGSFSDGNTIYVVGAWNADSNKGYVVTCNGITGVCVPRLLVNVSVDGMDVIKLASGNTAVYYWNNSETTSNLLYCDAQVDNCVFKYSTPNIRSRGQIIQSATSGDIMYVAVSVPATLTLAWVTCDSNLNNCAEYNYTASRNHWEVTDSVALREGQFAITTHTNEFDRCYLYIFNNTNYLIGGSFSSSSSLGRCGFTQMGNGRTIGLSYRWESTLSLWTRGVYNLTNDLVYWHDNAGYFKGNNLGSNPDILELSHDSLTGNSLLFFVTGPGGMSHLFGYLLWNNATGDIEYQGTDSTSVLGTDYDVDGEFGTYGGGKIYYVSALGNMVAYDPFSTTVMSGVSASMADPSLGDPVEGFCSHSGDDALYDYIWYADGAQVDSGTSSVYSAGGPNSIGTYFGFNAGQTLILSCRAKNLLYSTDWVNSSSYVVGNAPFRIVGNTFSGMSSNESIIKVVGADVWIRENTFSNNNISNDAIYLQNTTAKIDLNEFSGNKIIGAYGFVLMDTGDAGNFTNNNASSHTGDFLIVKGTGDLVAYNTFSDAGVVLSGAISPLVLSNYFTANVVDALTVEGALGALVNSNSYFGSGYSFVMSSGTASIVGDNYSATSARNVKLLGGTSTFSGAQDVSPYFCQGLEVTLANGSYNHYPNASTYVCPVSASVEGASYWYGDPFYAYDGDINTAAYGDATNRYIYLNYTKPAGASANASLISYYLGSNPDPYINANVSKPECISPVTQLRVLTEWNGPYAGRTMVECYDGSNWTVVIDNIGNYTDYGRIYEITMLWNVPSLITSENMYPKYMTLNTVVNQTVVYPTEGGATQAPISSAATSEGPFTCNSILVSTQGNLIGNCSVLSGQCTCVVSIPYTYEAGAYDMNMSLLDSYASLSGTLSDVILFNQLIANKKDRNFITFSGSILGVPNVKCDVPIKITNTGNANITNVTLKAYDLVGATDPTKKLLAVNFRAGAIIQDSVQLNDSQAIQLPISLAVGNQSIELNIWVSAPADLYSQYYAPVTPWELVLR